MESPAHWMTDLAGTLGTRFRALTVIRAGKTVGWTYGGRTVSVALADDGAIRASFSDARADDTVAGASVRCEYRPASGATYALSREGCARMVDDLDAFFSGAREPRFTFVGMREA